MDLPAVPRRRVARAFSLALFAALTVASAGPARAQEGATEHRGRTASGEAAAGPFVVEGCADLGSGAPRRLRIVRAVGWAAVPVGTALGFSASRLFRSYGPNGVHLSDVVLGLGTGLIGSGILTGSIAGMRLNRMCREDTVHARRHVRRMWRAGWAVLGAGVASIATMGIFFKRRPLNDAWDDVDIAGLYLMVPSAVLTAFGAGLLARSQNLRWERAEVLLGLGTLHVRGTF